MRRGKCEGCGKLSRAVLGREVLGRPICGIRSELALMPFPSVLSRFSALVVAVRRTEVAAGVLLCGWSAMSDSIEVLLCFQAPGDGTDTQQRREMCALLPGP